MANVISPPEATVYGGVNWDVQVGEMALYEPIAAFQSHRLDSLIAAPFYFAGAVADMPLSLIGDTLTLPWILKVTPLNSVYRLLPIRF